LGAWFKVQLSIMRAASYLQYDVKTTYLNSMQSPLLHVYMFG
jgi:hypothetical protein